ncbi:flagellar hook-length control protein FliK [Bradyrhizobium lablabi]|uniref:flagellar hook-length control protein FliK n=1 Tax=Bradyrhizobium lablabi TaxID=722472 RepID=UPI001BA9015B|nr:flagellar hook-length control protein FliK [Bradyrhizobium lablabi]MBR0694079.1 flagellar hook-length control protein FliK [Bradyrhizobium lablabi]
MVSVTSEALANLSFQGSTQWSARPDSAPPRGNDGFAALLDSSTAARNNDDRAPDLANPQPAPPRRADDSSQATDAPARDSATAPDRTTRNSDRADETQDDSKVGHDARPAKSRSKSDDAKSNGKSDAKADTEDDTITTGQADVGQDVSNVTPVVANAIPLAAAPSADAVVPAAASGNAAAPLAIAAAAIAASAAIAGTGGQAGTTDAATATAAAANAASVAKAVGVKTEAPIVTAADTATAQATSATTTGTATAGITLAATGKPAVKPQAATPLAVAATDQEGGSGSATTSTSDTPTTIIPGVNQPAAVAGKTKAEDGVIDAFKADVSGNATLTATVTGHSTAVPQTPVNAADTGASSANAIPLQVPATPATAQLTATAATQNTAVPLSGLAVEIAASVKSGKSRFEIRLDPAELGRIDVRIDVDRNGQVTSHLTVERPETLSMLRQDANQLQRALDNAGLSTGNGGLQFSLRDQSQSGQNSNGQSNPNAHRLIVSEEETIPAAIAGRSYGRMAGATSGVDIRV